MMSQVRLRGTLEDRIVEAIEARILSGDLRAGAWLRQEALAAELGVSHIPLREAFRKLASRGFIELHPNRGAFVTKLTRRDVLEVLETRVLLESAALLAAIPKFSPADANRAAAAIDAIERASAAEYPELNWRFHQALYASCDKALLMRLIEQVHHDARSGRLHRLVTHDIKKANSDHRRLLALVKAKDVAKAISCLRRHVGVTSKDARSRVAALEE